MKKLRAISCALIVLVMLVSLFGCGGTPNPTATSGGGNSAAPTGSSAPSSTPAPTVSTAPTDEFVSYSIGVTSFLGRLYGGLSPTECHSATDAIFDVIFRPDPITKEIFSYILTDWYWEDDTTFIMEMRDDIYFNNGDNATSADLLYSYTSYVDRGSTALNTYGILFDECETRGDYTVAMKFEQFYAPFLNYTVYLTHKEWAESIGFESMEWLDPVCSGPYEVFEYVNDDRIVLQHREDYWNKDVGDYYVDEWRIMFYPDASTMYMDLEVGKIDMCEVQAADYSRFLRTGGDGFDVIKKGIGTVTSFYFGYLNRPDDPIWYNKNLREAVAIGVDWNAMGQVTYQDQYVRAQGVTPIQSPGFIDAGWDTLEYNPERAKEILIEEGYGPDNPLKLHSYMMDGAAWKTLNETLQFQLSQIGIIYDVEFVDTPTAMDHWNQFGTVDVGFHWYHRGSAAFELRQSLPYIKVLPTGQKFTMIDDELTQELYNKLMYTRDEDERYEAGVELQQRFRDEYLIIPIAEMMMCAGFRTDRLTQQQVESVVIAANIYQLSRLGMLSSFQQ